MAQCCVDLQFYTTVGEVEHKEWNFRALGHITPQWQINVGTRLSRPKDNGGSKQRVDTAGHNTSARRQLFLPKQTGKSVHNLLSGRRSAAWFVVPVAALRYVGPQPYYMRESPCKL